jgi:hypothetical protein
MIESAKSKKIVWMHPSYRDLLIDEMMVDRELRVTFLQNLSLSGYKLVLSDTGGASGKRSFPFMVDRESWDLLRESCVRLVEQSRGFSIQSMLIVVINAIKHSQDKTINQELIATLQVTLEQLFEKMNKSKNVFGLGELESYLDASLLIKPLPPIPNLDPVWVSILSNVIEHLAKVESGYLLEAYHLQSWADLIKIIQKNEPRFLRQVEFPQKFDKVLTDLISVLENEARGSMLLTEYDELKAEAERLYDLSVCCEDFSDIAQIYHKKFEDLADQFAIDLKDFEEKASKLEPPEAENDLDRSDRDSDQDDFDIKALFKDL